MHHIKINSHTPFGDFTQHNNFKLDYGKVPFYDIPDTKDFYMKPFMSKKLPYMTTTQAEDGQVTLTPEMIEKVRIQILLSDNAEIRKLGLELFETKFGQMAIKEFIKSQNANEKNTAYESPAVQKNMGKYYYLYQKE